MQLSEVVVLEDNEFAASVIRRTLELAGYRCVEVRSAQDTLEYCRTNEEKVRAIILDLILPGCRGTDVALQVAQHCPGVRVLFVSGTPYEAWPENEFRKVCALPAGMAGFLGKPFRPNAMIDKLAELLDGRSKTPVS